MPVYVDRLFDYKGEVKPPAKRYGTIWCHMYADTEYELDQMAL